MSGAELIGIAIGVVVAPFALAYGYKLGKKGSEKLTKKIKK